MPEFGMSWEVPNKPSIDDALVAVRLQARLDGILIPEDAEPTIAEHLPSDRNPNGGLDVIFEWGVRSTTTAEERSRRAEEPRGDFANLALAMDRSTMNTSDIGRYLHVTRERARQVVNDHESFPVPVVTTPRRRWDAAEVKGWAERHWWGTLPWRGESASG